MHSAVLTLSAGALSLQGHVRGQRRISGSGNLSLLGPSIHTSTHFEQKMYSRAVGRGLKRCRCCYWGQCTRQRVLGEEWLACKWASRAGVQTGTSLWHAEATEREQYLSGGVCALFAPRVHRKRLWRTRSLPLTLYRASLLLRHVSCPLPREECWLWQRLRHIPPSPPGPS